MTPHQEIILYGAAASGSVAVEAALTLLDIPFQLIEGETWSSEAARVRVGERNAMRQIPTMILPGGEMLTESAAILVHLADSRPLRGCRWVSTTRRAGSSCAGCSSYRRRSTRCIGLSPT
jgi:GST-like protein